MKKGNSHPDLQRFATWAAKAMEEQDQKKSKAAPRREGYVDPEVTAHTPPPKVMIGPRHHRGANKASSSDDWGELLDPPAPAERAAAAKATATKGQRRGRDQAPPPEMDQDVAEEAREEIEELEMRLATLRQKHGIAPKSFPRGPREPRD